MILSLLFLLSTKVFPVIHIDHVAKFNALKLSQEQKILNMQKSIKKAAQGSKTYANPAFMLASGEKDPRRLRKLNDCHPTLKEMVKFIDSRTKVLVFTCTRSKEEQAKMLKLGKSKVTVSRHNSTPAMAVDMVPLQKDGKVIWDDWDKLYLLNALALEWYGHNQKRGCVRGHQMRLGISWVSLSDPYHIELVDCAR